ncbi:hypothetical protein ACFLYL_03965 [Chloroflexota bacterium]
MSKHILQTTAILILVILLTFFAALPVLAMDARSGDTINVASEEVVDGDLYVAGRTIVIDGTINGDVFGAGQTITINGNVNGGVTIAGQTVTINGRVTHGARLAGQTITVSGNIGRDLLAGGSTLDITSTANIVRDFVFGTGTSRIDGHINGNILGGGGEITIADGNVRLEVDKLTIASTANIQGSLAYSSENEANIQSGAQIAGTTTHKLPEIKKAAEAEPFSEITGKVLAFFMALIIGVVIIFIDTRRKN